LEIAVKIRHPLLIKSAGIVGAWVLRIWMRSLRFQQCPLGENFDPNQPGLSGRFIYAMWHEYLLLPVYHYARPDIHVLVSHHTDGDIIAGICRNLGVPAVRGSTTRGAVQAVRGLLRAGRDTHLAVTPDGPHGPRRRVKPGVIFLAAELGLPIVPVGFGLQNPWRLRSWDSFALPRPGNRATCVTGSPIHVPPHANGEVRAECRVRLDDALAEATGAAEAWAETGIRPTPVIPGQGSFAAA
jgi:lysophospholipid acyltransferase (LPLAT)-like uncharacterized protein